MSPRVGARPDRFRALLRSLGFTGAGVTGWRDSAACADVDPEHVDRTTAGDHGVSGLTSLLLPIVLPAWLMIRIESLPGWCYRGGGGS